MAGFYYDNRKNRYIARIRVDGERIHLGSFKTPKEAQNAYARAKKEKDEHQSLLDKVELKYEEDDKAFNPFRSITEWLRSRKKS